NDASRELLDTTRDRFDIDLSNELMNWSRRGVFMYSTVHPMSFTLFDLSKKLFEKIGLKFRTVNFNYYDIHDLARSEIFPIYPPIAKRYGAQGGYMFKLQNHHLATTVGDFLTLPQYIASCYKIYGKHDPAKLSNPRVDAWLADEETTGLLMRLARENFAAGLTPVL
ncbi:MAG: WcbI family polysaccharide biosynthesis putative acetyltransferase, partial [Methylocystis sp.]